MREPYCAYADEDGRKESKWKEFGDVASCTEVQAAPFIGDDRALVCIMESAETLLLLVVSRVSFQIARDAVTTPDLL